MDMSEETRRLMFQLGMEDEILTYFAARGPMRMHNQMRVEILFADFSDGPDVNLTTHSSFSDLEVLRNERDATKIYYRRGRGAGEDLITFLTNSARFEQHIREQWWFRGYYRTKEKLQKAFALLAFWKYTWVTKLYSCFNQDDLYKGLDA